MSIRRRRSNLFDFSWPSSFFLWRWSLPRCPPDGLLRCLVVGAIHDCRRGSAIDSSSNTCSGDGGTLLGLALEHDVSGVIHVADRCTLLGDDNGRRRRRTGSHHPAKGGRGKPKKGRNSFIIVVVFVLLLHLVLHRRLRY